MTIGDTPPTGDTARGAAARTAWLPVWVVAFAVFTVTTTEMAPVGLIPQIAADLRVSEGGAGASMTAFGLVAGVLAPFMTSWTGRADRRALLLLILAVFAAGNLVTALSQDYPLFILSRVAVGAIHGLMWSIVATIAIRLVPPRDAVRATSIAFSGISLALVLGVPLGTLLGDAWGWRSAFAVLAGMSLVGLLLVATAVPRLPAQESVQSGDFRSLARSRPFLCALLVTCLVVVGNYAAYTYVAPFLIGVHGVIPTLIGPALLVYGVAGVAGNFLSGHLLHRSGKVSSVLGTLTLAVTAALILLLAPVPGPVVLMLLIAWGLAYSGLPVALQTLVLRAAGPSGQAATSVYVLVFNVSIAAGALAGGLAIDVAGPAAPLWTGIGFSLAAAVVILIAVRGGPADAPPVLSGHPQEPRPETTNRPGTG